jgi:hypothetical protein
MLICNAAKKKLNPALDKAGFFFLNTLKTQNTLLPATVLANAGKLFTQ